jgi:hypothetical protein
MKIKDAINAANGREEREFTETPSKKKELNSFFENKVGITIDTQRIHDNALKNVETSKWNKMLNKASDEVKEVKKEVKKLRNSVKDEKLENIHLKGLVNSAKKDALIRSYNYYHLRDKELQMRDSLVKVYNYTYYRKESLKLKDELNQLKDYINFKQFRELQRRNDYYNDQRINTFFSNKSSRDEHLKKNVASLPEVIKYSKINNELIIGESTVKIPEGSSLEGIELFIRSLFPNAEYTLVYVDAASSVRNAEDEPQTAPESNDTDTEEGAKNDEGDQNENTNRESDSVNKNSVTVSEKFADLLTQYCDYLIKDSDLIKFVTENRDDLPEVFVDIVENLKYGSLTVEYYNSIKDKFEEACKKENVKIPNFKLLVSDSKVLTKRDLQKKIGNVATKKVFDSVPGVPEKFIYSNKKLRLDNEVMLKGGTFVYAVF